MDKQATQLIIMAALAIALAVFGYVALTSQKQLNDVPDELFCEQDSDCVPAQCCHSTSAVNKANAPDCSDTFCTQVCEPDTLDCQQGEVRCVRNRCAVVIK